MTAPSADANGWRDISSAPRDGTYVLLNYAGVQVPVIAFWNGSGGWDDGDYQDHMTGFTHWMPLPLPPPPTSE